MGTTAVLLLFFALGALVILLAGTGLTRAADALADRTGMGEAVTGALLLGGMTSLPGLIASANAAWNGLPNMAMSNAVGGIAAQTLFLVIADLTYKRGNLEHAAASHTNLFQGAHLIVLLAFPLVAMNLEAFSTWRVHPVSFVMIAFYLFSHRTVGRVQKEGMWRPRLTRETRQDVPEEENRARPLRWLVLGFIGLGLTTAAAGWTVGHTGIRLVSELGWRETLVGGLMTGVASSLPELVTTLAAVRRGAFTLAVSGIVGGNAFDTLFVAVSDACYREGSIYHAIADRQEFLLATAIVMSAVLLGGMLRREKAGPANIGSEGILLIACYALFVWGTGW